MTTKIKKLYFPIVIAAIVSSLVISCAKDDNTGASTMNPTSPTITVTSGFSNPTTLVENDSVFEYTVTMSVAQLVDVKLKVAQVGGTASSADYEMSSEIYITAGSTSAKGKIKILKDDLAEPTENLIIEIGNNETANATFAPIRYVFSILNVTADNLVLDLSWETDAETSIGVVGLKSTDIVDMRLLVVDSNGDILVAADGPKFENYSGFDTLPDGTYTIATDIYSVKDFGSLNSTITLDLNLAFYQLGVYNEVISMPQVMNTVNPCDAYRVILATVVKAGSSFTYEKTVSIPEEALAGNWAGYDADPGYSSEVVSAMVGGKLQFEGIGRGWMQDLWGEVIVKQLPIQMQFNFCDGTIVIPSQEIMNTTYKGAAQPAYNIVGTGTFDVSGAFPVMSIQYDFVQNGHYIAVEGFGIPYFELELTLDPGGLKAGKLASSQVSQKLVKPVR